MISSADISNEQGDIMDNIVILNDALGREHSFELLDIIAYEGREYIILLPTEDETGEVVILKLEGGDNDGNESYVSVEDEETLNAVYAIFKKKHGNDFDFAD